MSRATPPVRWGPNEPVSSEKLNRMTGEGIREITVGRGLKIVRTPGGRVAISRIEDSVPRNATDYSVYIGAAILSSGQGTGEYTGYCYRTLPTSSGSFDPAQGTPCHIRNDEEWHGSGPTAYPTSWIQVPATSVGRFDGEYTTDTPPQPIIHIGGGASYIQDTTSSSDVPFFVGQSWNRHNPNLGFPGTAGATAVLGDEAVQIRVPTTNAGKYRYWYFDRGGNLWKIGPEV